jgi:hypothetical protein
VIFVFFQYPPEFFREARPAEGYHSLDPAFVDNRHNSGFYRPRGFARAARSKKA